MPEGGKALAAEGGGRQLRHVAVPASQEHARGGAVLSEQLQGVRDDCPKGRRGEVPVPDGRSRVVVREAVNVAEELRRVRAALALEVDDDGVEGLGCGLACGASSEALAVLPLPGQEAGASGESGHSRVDGELGEVGAERLRRLRRRRSCTIKRSRQ